MSELKDYGDCQHVMNEKIHYGRKGNEYRIFYCIECDVVLKVFRSIPGRWKYIKIGDLIV